MSTINIANLDKAEVLAALYNASKQQGIGVMDMRGREQMTVDQANAEIMVKKNLGAGMLYWDYLYGRVMKSQIDVDEFDPYGFDRDNGTGAAANALEPLIKKASK